LATAADTWAGSTRNRIEWCTIAGLPGRKATPVTNADEVSSGSTRKQR
jgi:hypothetical protein